MWRRHKGRFGPKSWPNKECDGRHVFYFRPTVWFNTVIKINNFRGELTGNSAKKEALRMTSKYSNADQTSEPFRNAICYPMLDIIVLFQGPAFCCSWWLVTSPQELSIYTIQKFIYWIEMSKKSYFNFEYKITDKHLVVAKTSSSSLSLAFIHAESRSETMM